MRRILLTMALFAIVAFASAQSVTEFVSRQMTEYPQSRLLDIYKSCFQDYMGAEHLVPDTASVKKYLDYEFASTKTEDLQPWYYEPCGINGNYVRVSIRTIKEGIISESQLLDAFIRSTNSSKRPSVETWIQKWHEINDSIDSMDISLPHYADDKQYIDSILSVGKYAISHSKEYREAYHPHYRIVSHEIFDKEIYPLVNQSKFILTTTGHLPIGCVHKHK